MDTDQLISDVEEIVKISCSFRERIEFTETSWTTESEALNLFESQLNIFETTKDLVTSDRFTEAFILTRTVFENYFLISLILKGT